jgi:hypothetical protein
MSLFDISTPTNQPMWQSGAQQHSDERLTTIDDENLHAEVFCMGNGYYRIRGVTKPMIDGLPVSWRASNPPDSHLSVAGTALPFPTEEVAMSGSAINVGSKLSGQSGAFDINVLAPNSYYTCGGRNLVLPQVQLIVDYGKMNRGQKVYNIPLNTGYKSRSLTNLPNRPNRTTGR